MTQTQTARPPRKTPRPDSLAGRLALLDRTRAEHFEARRKWLAAPAGSSIPLFRGYADANRAHGLAFIYARTANQIPA